MSVTAPAGKNPRKALKLVAFGIGVFFLACWSLAFPILFPPAWKADLNKAVCLLNDNKIEDADKMYRQSITDGVTANIQPGEMVQPYFYYARFLFDQGRLQESIEPYKKAAEMAHKAGLPAFEAQAYGGICASEHHMFKRGLIKSRDTSYAEKALALWKTPGIDLRDGDLEFAYSNLGNAYGDNGDFAKAIEHFQQAIESAQKDKDNNSAARAQIAMAATYLQAGDLAAATDNYSHAVALAADADEDDLCRRISEYGKAIQDNENNAELQQIKSQTEELLAAHKWSSLDKLADSLRASKAMTINGRWQLDELYDTIDAIDDESASDARWKEHLSDLRQWVDTNPNSITARVALADALVSYAWEARGSGWGSEVTAEGAKQMEERLEEAQKTLTEATKLKNKCPRWYNAMQRVALGQGWDIGDYDAMVAKGLAAFPTYYPIYYSEVYFLQPRWYGEQDSWVAFLNKAANKLGGAEGDKLYARGTMYLDRMCLSGQSNLFDAYNTLEWPRVKRGLAVLAKEYPKSKRLHAHAAKLAVDGHDKGAAQAIAKAYKI